MPFDILPRSFFNFGSRMPSFWDEEDWASFLPSSGLTVSEDDKQIFVEAAVPGIDPDKVEVTFDKGVLWIRGNQDHEDKDQAKKYYRRASKSFSYRVAIPGNVDEQAEPQAEYKNGIMKVSFPKLPEVKPKKITIKKA